MLDKGRLNPRETGRFVSEHSDGEVKISKSGVEAVARLVLGAVRSGKMRDVDFDAHELHPKGADRAAVEWVFFMDTINFSFWSEEDAKFVVTYKGKPYTGYYAGCACVDRALDSGIPLTTADYMQNITLEDVKKIFVSDDGAVIPMAEERTNVLREAGKVLNEEFGGSFYHCVENCRKSAMNLLKTVVENFESYRDFGEFKGKKERYAGLTVTEHHVKIPHMNGGDAFRELTMFADYRVPQALAHLGALHYSSKLIRSLRANPVLPNGCPLEVELRGFSIKACDDIVDAAKRLRTDADTHLKTITAVDVDMFLWVYRREHAAEIEKNIAYHRVRSIYY
ncbi:UPF0553 protein C9orf64 [Toxocara canis]|uniref:Queuosine 5'-phosphate N-glycosylase/hydrolase n=1 Tax=Toxocara canis TaxID=6265 RepID=A0A0B2V8G7_TOXCA|nr:UPF0553 protein C9orf64 [Toxocara canis]